MHFLNYEKEIRINGDIYLITSLFLFSLRKEITCSKAKIQKAMGHNNVPLVNQ